MEGNVPRALGSPMHLPDPDPSLTWEQGRAHSPSAVGACNHPPQTGFGFHSLFVTYLGLSAPSHLSSGQCCLSGLDEGRVSSVGGGAPEAGGLEPFHYYQPR